MIEVKRVAKSYGNNPVIEACSLTVEDILQAVGLENASGKHVSAYSMGMKQRLAIARALLHEPDVLVLDEPFQDGGSAEFEKEVLQILKSI